MLPRLCSPPPPQPPHGAKLWGAETLQNPTLTGPTARGSSNALLLQFQKASFAPLWEHFFYSHEV